MKHKLMISEEIISSSKKQNYAGSGLTEVAYRILHKQMRRKVPKPNLCPICVNVPPYDMANITGIYNQDLKNWQWQCRSCHVKDHFRNGTRKNHLANNNPMFGKRHTDKTRQKMREPS